MELKKQELKDNDIVELRNGEIRRIELNKDNTFSVVGLENYCSLNDYNDNLKNMKTKYYDIVRIYKCYKRLEILSDEEKSYLKNFIKPFKNRIEYICKLRYDSIDKEFLLIAIKDDTSVTMPDFNINEYYVGMENDKTYSLEELGL